MFPVGDDEVVGGAFPIMNLAIIALNVLVFLFELTFSDTGLQSFFQQWAVVPVQVQQGQSLVTLVTSMFLHGGWLHIIGNMLFLYVFGDNIEDTIGPLPYLIFYLACGLIAGVTHVLFNAGSTLPSLGASGAIAGVLGTYIVLFPQARVRVLFITPYIRMGAISALLFLGFWAVTQFFNGVASLGAATAQTSGVAVWAHVGGFLSGLVLGFVIKGIKGSPPLDNRV